MFSGNDGLGDGPPQLGRLSSLEPLEYSGLDLGFEDDGLQPPSLLSATADNDLGVLEQNEVYRSMDFAGMNESCRGVLQGGEHISVCVQNSNHSPDGGRLRQSHHKRSTT
jgi:hypothetical protein